MFNLVFILRGSSLLSLLLSVLFCSVASAQLISFKFSGTVIAAPFEELPIGDTCAGSFTFESSTPDSHTDPRVGDYREAIRRIDLTCSNGYVLTQGYGRVRTFEGINVHDECFGCRNGDPDSISYSTGNATGGPVHRIAGPDILNPGAEANFSHINLNVGGRLAGTDPIQSDALPVSPPNLAEFSTMPSHGTSISIHFFGNAVGPSL